MLQVTALLHIGSKIWSVPTLAHIYCRLDSQAKGLRLAEITECKEGLESKLEQLNEAHSALTQQHEGLEADLTQVQGSLQAAEAARASAEVATPCFAAVGSQFLRQSQTWTQVQVLTLRAARVPLSHAQ